MATTVFGTNTDLPNTTLPSPVSVGYHAPSGNTLGSAVSDIASTVSQVFSGPDPYASVLNDLNEKIDRIRSDTKYRGNVVQQNGDVNRAISDAQRSIDPKHTAAFTSWIETKLGTTEVIDGKVLRKDRFGNVISTEDDPNSAPSSSGIMMDTAAQYSANFEKGAQADGALTQGLAAQGVTPDPHHVQGHMDSFNAEHDALLNAMSENANAHRLASTQAQIDAADKKLERVIMGVASSSASKYWDQRTLMQVAQRNLLPENVMAAVVAHDQDYVNMLNRTGRYDMVPAVQKAQAEQREILQKQLDYVAEGGVKAVKRASDIADYTAQLTKSNIFNTMPAVGQQAIVTAPAIQALATAMPLIQSSQVQASVNNQNPTTRGIALGLQSLVGGVSNTATGQPPPSQSPESAAPSGGKNLDSFLSDRQTANKTSAGTPVNAKKFGQMTRYLDMKDSQGEAVAAMHDLRENAATYNSLTTFMPKVDTREEAISVVNDIDAITSSASGMLLYPSLNALATKQFLPKLQELEKSGVITPEESVRLSLEMKQFLSDAHIKWENWRQLQGLSRDKALQVPIDMLHGTPHNLVIEHPANPSTIDSILADPNANESRKPLNGGK